MLKTFFTKTRIEIILTSLVLILVGWLLFVVNESNKVIILENYDRDINFEYFQAKQIGSGENPYERIESGNLLWNDKYATLFPLYYYFLHFIDNLSENNFDIFLQNFRHIVYTAEIISALAVYLIFRAKEKRYLGFVAGTFLLFNRWSISNVGSAKQDFIAIAFMLFAFYLFQTFEKKKLYWAYLLFGISIGIKHIGIFISPVFLLPLLDRKFSVKERLFLVILFLIPTIGVGLPIILDKPTAFFYSMLFSFTRIPSITNGDFGYSNLLVLYDVGVKNNSIMFYLLPRLPLVIFSLLNFFALVFKKISIFGFSLASLFIFTAFNPVLFDQYFTWIVPFIFLATLDINLKNFSKNP